MRKEVLIVRIALLVLTILSTLSTRGFGQTVTGSFRGKVTDATGGVVVGATIKVEGSSTGLAREGASQSTGSYVIPALPPGFYKITANAQGFKTTVRPNVQLLVNQDLELNFQLEVGEVTETLEVTATPPGLQTTNATLGQVIEQEQLKELPLNGRQFSQLILLAPGASPHQSGQQNSFTVALGSGGISPAVNGQRAQQNNFTLDGLPNNSVFINTWAISPPPDAIQEFKVQNQQVDGQFSVSSGANVNVVMHSGTTEFHGAAWEFLRNDVLDARNAFDYLPDRRLPSYRQNQYGFTTGGPLLLPGYNGREKRTFFFGYWEGFRSFKGVSQLASVPTQAVRAGDLSALLGSVIGTDALGREVRGNQVFDPFTTREVVAGQVDPLSGLVAGRSGLVNEPFGNNIIPRDRLRPETLAQFDRFYPLPNSPGQTLNLRLANPKTIENDQFGIKIDHLFKNNDTFNGAFYYSEPYQLVPNGLPADPNPTSNGTRSVNLTHTHTFNPTTLLSLRYGYMHSNWRLGFGLPVDEAFVTATKAGVLNPIKQGIPLGFWPIPALYNNAPQFTVPLGPQRTHTFMGDVAKTKGNHELGFGALYYRIHNFDDGWGMQTGFQRTQTMSPGISGSGYDAASWLLGLPNNLSGWLGDTAGDFKINWIGGYAQDKWRVSDKLTLHFAMRYDLVSPPHFKNDQWSGFDLETGTFRVTQPVPPQFPQANIRKTYFDPHYNGWQPRFGFAYKATEKTVVRGAFSMFHDHTQNLLEAIQAGRAKWPWGGNVSFLVNQQNIQPAASACRNSGGAPNCGPEFFLYNTPPAESYYGPNSPPIAGASTDPHNHTPYVMSYNLTIQRLISSSTTLEMSYVGSLGRNQFVQQTINTARDAGTGPLQARLPFPNFTPGMFYATNIGRSAYNGLQAKLEKRLSQGLSFLGSYTWSKAMDHASDGYSGNVDAWDLKRYWARSNFDLTHIAVFSSLYQLPFGKNKAFIGGWNIGGVVTLQTGPPFFVAVLGDPANVGCGGCQRAQLVGDPLPTDFVRTTDKWFNTAAFAQPTFGTFGNSGRNILNYPGYQNVDFYLSKNFKVTERINLQFRTEFFNLFNHPTYGPVGVSGSAYSGGQQTQTVGTAAFGRLLSASLSREIQFGLKLAW